jgi:hypothetical protein
LQAITFLSQQSDFVASAQSLPAEQHTWLMPLPQESWVFGQHTFEPRQFSVPVSQQRFEVQTVVPEAQQVPAFESAQVSPSLQQWPFPQDIGQQSLPGVLASPQLL